LMDKFVDRQMDAWMDNLMDKFVDGKLGGWTIN
jgi:hypothetical protein